MIRKRALRIGALTVLSLAGGALLFTTYRDFLQAQRDFALFKAITADDTRATLSALNAGANANALYPGTTPPTLQARCRVRLQALFHAPPPRKTEETALRYVFDRWMDTPAHPHTPARFSENAEIVDTLLEHGADPNQVDPRGTTPLMRAAFLTYPNSILRLLQHGANVHARDSHGETALHHAATGRSAAIIHLLLSQGAEIDAQDKDGNTALSLAADFNHTEIVKALLAGHADVHLKDKQGDGALEYAQRVEADEIVMLLRQAGAKANGTVAYREPPDVPKSAPIAENTTDLLDLATRSIVSDVRDPQDANAYFWASDRQVLWIQPDAAHKHFQMELIDTPTGAKTPLTSLTAYARTSMPVVFRGTVSYISTKEVIPQYTPPTSVLSPDCKWLLWAPPNPASHTWQASTLDGREQRQWKSVPNRENAFWLPDNSHWMQFVRATETSGYRSMKIYSLKSEEKPREVRIQGVEDKDDLIMLGATDRQTALGYRFPISFRPNRAYVDMEEIGYSHTTEHSRSFRVKLPRPALALPVLLAPTGDRIAWMLSDGKSDSFKGEIWISDSRGQGMHLLGRLEGEFPLWRNLHWLPDGKHLSFREQDALWTVPVP